MFSDSIRILSVFSKNSYVLYIKVTNIHKTTPNKLHNLKKIYSIHQKKVFPNIPSGSTNNGEQTCK